MPKFYSESGKHNTDIVLEVRQLQGLSKDVLANTPEELVEAALKTEFAFTNPKEIAPSLLIYADLGGKYITNEVLSSQTDPNVAPYYQEFVQLLPFDLKYPVRLECGYRTRGDASNSLTNVRYAQLVKNSARFDLASFPQRWYFNPFSCEVKEGATSIQAAAPDCIMGIAVSNYLADRNNRNLDEMSEQLVMGLAADLLMSKKLITTERTFAEVKYEYAKILAKNGFNPYLIESLEDYVFDDVAAEIVTLQESMVLAGTLGRLKSMLTFLDFANRKTEEELFDVIQADFAGILLNRINLTQNHIGKTIYSEPE